MARVVHEPPVDRVIDPLPSGRWPLQLNDILALAANLSAAGYELGGTIEKVEALTEALDRRLAVDLGRYLTEDLLDLPPDEVAERCRQAGLDLAAGREMAQARRGFDERLALDAASSLRSNSDQIVQQMREVFDPAVDAVRNAAAVGLTASTDPRGLADTADGETLDAYRRLAPAVVDLDRIAALRFQMASTANIGPADYLIANLVTAGSIAALDGAQAVWQGEVETVAVELPSGGHHSARTRRPRLGGPWLALAGADFEIRLNTAAEADAVVAAARRATVG